MKFPSIVCTAPAMSLVGADAGTHRQNPVNVQGGFYFGDALIASTFSLHDEAWPTVPQPRPGE